MSSSLRVVAFASCAVFAATAAAAQAAAPSFRDALAHTMAVRGVRDLGRANPRQRIELTVTFRRRHEAELANLVTAQGDRSSHYYGQYVTPRQFDAYFGPSAATIASVTKTLAARGFVEEPGALPSSVKRFAGTVSSVDAMFATEMHSVVQAGRGVRYVHVRPIAMPAQFSNRVLSVSGFDNIDDRVTPSVPRASIRPASIANDNALASTNRANRSDPRFPAHACGTPTAANTADLDTAEPTANGNPGYGPSTFEYDFDLPIERGCGGRGVTIGVLGVAEPNPSDIASFYSYFNVARTLPPYTLRTTQTGTDVPNSEQTEGTLDIDTVTSLAPDSPVIFYQMADPSFASVIGAMNAAAADNVVSVLSISYEDCEGGDSMDTLATDSAAEQLVAQGITVAAGSGDTGYDSCFFSPGIGGPASSQYVVAVGGVGPAVATGGTSAYHSVTGWSGSGGGESAFVPRPGYQKRIHTCVGAFRCVPDLALASGLGTYPQVPTAIDGAFIYAGGGTTVAISGTSLATPIFAAMQAEVDQYSRRRHGFVNPLLYGDALLFGGKQGGFNPLRVFADVTTGNNGEPAVADWDYVTGLGVPDGLALTTVESFF